jgi:hypothetical protein
MKLRSLTVNIVSRTYSTRLVRFRPGRSHSSYDLRAYAAQGKGRGSSYLRRVYLIEEGCNVYTPFTSTEPSMR